MKAVRYRTGPGEYRIGRLEAIRSSTRVPRESRDSSRRRAAWAELAAADGPRTALDAVTLAHPVVPRKLICIGLNYRDHAEESELDLPEVPVIFAKWTTSLIGHGETIVIPREETRPDYEGEVAVVIGEPVYRATGAAARAAVGAYTCFHDVSGRRAQLETPLRQFTYGKSFDTFGPLGPWLVDAEGVDLDALDIETVVSGETLQRSNTRNLIFGVEALVEYVSRGTTLEPGDVIATGTPGGVGDARDPKRYLREGDVVDITRERRRHAQQPRHARALRGSVARGAGARPSPAARARARARRPRGRVRRRASRSRSSAGGGTTRSCAPKRSRTPWIPGSSPTIQTGTLTPAESQSREPPRVGAAAQHVDAVEPVERAVALAAERDRDAPRIGAQVGEVAHARPCRAGVPTSSSPQSAESSTMSGQVRASSSASATGARLGDPRHGVAPAEPAMPLALRTSAGVALASMRTMAAGRSPSSDARPRRSAQAGLSSATRPSDARPKAGPGEAICKAFARAAPVGFIRAWR